MSEMHPNIYCHLCKLNHLRKNLLYGPKSQKSSKCNLSYDCFVSKVRNDLFKLKGLIQNLGKMLLCFLAELDEKIDIYLFKCEATARRRFAYVYKGNS